MNVKQLKQILSNLPGDTIVRNSNDQKLHLVDVSGTNACYLRLSFSSFESPVADDELFVLETKTDKVTQKLHES